MAHDRPRRRRAGCRSPYQDRDRHRRHVHRRRRARRGHRRAGHHQDAVDPERPLGGLHGRRREGARPARCGRRATSLRSCTAPRWPPTTCSRARSGPLGLITTEGYEFILEIARQSVPDGYGNCYFWVKPPRIVPADLVRTVGGRLDPTGARDPAVRPRAGGGRRALVPRRAGCARSACASCTPTPTRQHEQAMARGARRGAPRGRGLDLQRGAARVPRVRAER